MHAPTLRKVVSGGQTGVDQAALRAARDAGLAIGGWCPPGRASDSGPIPHTFPLIETPGERSELAPEVPRSLRTEWNARDADAALILASAVGPGDPGTAFTVECAHHYGRPTLSCDPGSPGGAERVVDWIRSLGVETLNVAGPSEAACAGAGDAAYVLLAKVFERCADLGA